AGIRTTDRAGFVVLTIEIVCIAAFCIAAALSPPLVAVEERPPMTAWALLHGASLLALSFLGFDAITTLSEEAKNPRRDVPRAVVTTCFIAGIMFCGVCAIAFRAYPVTHFDIPEIAAYTMAEAIAGQRMAFLVTIALLVGAIASTLASHAGAARLLFGMSRATGLAKPLSRIHATRRTPQVAIIVVAVIGLSAFGLSLEDSISFVNFGALASFLVVHVSVISHFVWRRRATHGAALLWYLLLPILGILATGALLWGLNTRAKVAGIVWLALGLFLARRVKSEVHDPLELDDDSSP
ncbi:MAG TPA: APC family permease, partial [Polyangium sp.]|nr:APC family permease [Polyangium sp.]